MADPTHRAVAGTAARATLDGRRPGHTVAGRAHVRGTDVWSAGIRLPGRRLSRSRLSRVRVPGVRAPDVRGTDVWSAGIRLPGGRLPGVWLPGRPIPRSRLPDVRRTRAGVRLCGLSRLPAALRFPATPGAQEAADGPVG